MSLSKLSIIVPLYNSEKYLENTIISLINQTYSNIEVLLIDDGSSDKSLQICQSYAISDPRIVIITKTNGGQASARNLGLDIATGKYITFVDSDDLLDVNTYKSCISYLENHNMIDVVQFPSFRNYSTKDQYLYRPKKMTISKDNLFNNWIVENNISWLVWDKVYRKDIFTDLRFENMFYEDNFMVAKILNKINNLAIIENGIYYYYRRFNSITTSSHSLKKEIDTQKVNWEIYNNLKKYDNTDVALIIVNEKILNTALSLSRNYNIVPTLFSKSDIKFKPLFVSKIPIKQKMKLLLFYYLGFKFVSKL